MSVMPFVGSVPRFVSAFQVVTVGEALKALAPVPDQTIWCADTNGGTDTRRTSGMTE
jgi:hypothetical protein